MVRALRPTCSLLALLASVGLAACGSDDRAEPVPPVDPGPGDGGSPGGDPGDTGGDPGDGGPGDTGGDDGGGTTSPIPDPGSGSGSGTGGDGTTGGGGGPADGGGTPGAPGATVFVRMLGGAGAEVAVGPLAFGLDGGFAALSLIGETQFFPPFLGLSRLDANGGTLWARTFDTGGEELVDVHVAISPLGNVFLALTAPYHPIDLGAGPVSGAFVAKYGPDGRFVWQREVYGTASLAVDASGSVLVGGGSSAQKLRWDGFELWNWAVPVGDHPGPAQVAFDAQGNAVVAHGDTIYELNAEGVQTWSARLFAPFVQLRGLGTTAKGTVVAAGIFSGSVMLGFDGETVRPVSEEYNDGAFLLAVETDGRPRWLRAVSLLTNTGQLGVDPAGRIALLEGDPRYGCGDQLVKLDLTGKELWRRRVAVCEAEPTFGSFARGVGVAPSGAIWVQGDANRPFDLGTGVLTPRQSDWWLLRVAP